LVEAMGARYMFVDGMLKAETGVVTMILKIRYFDPGAIVLVALTKQTGNSLRAEMGLVSIKKFLPLGILAYPVIKAGKPKLCDFQVP